MAHVVINEFIDTSDHRHHYRVGDKFPRGKVRVSQKRIDELKSDHKKYGIPFIAEVDEETETEE